MNNVIVNKYQFIPRQGYKYVIIITINSNNLIRIFLVNTWTQSNVSLTPSSVLLAGIEESVGVSMERGVSTLAGAGSLACGEAGVAGALFALFTVAVMVPPSENPIPVVAPPPDPLPD